MLEKSDFGTAQGHTRKRHQDNLLSSSLLLILQKLLAGRCKAGSEIKPTVSTSQLPETLVPGKLVPSSGLPRNCRDASKTPMQLNTNFYNLYLCVCVCGKTQSQFLSTHGFGLLFLMEVTLSYPIDGNSTQSDMID